MKTHKDNRTSELETANRALRMLYECNQTIVHAANETDLLQDICKTIVEVGGYRLAWVGFAEQDEEKTVRPVAQAGYEEGYLESLRITWAETERGRGPTGRAVRTGQPCIGRNFLTDPDFEPWRAEALKRGYASSISLPLIADHQTIGALTMYSVKPDAFDSHEVSLLKEMADDIAYCISALRLRAKHLQAEEELKKTKEKLEESHEQLRSLYAHLQAVREEEKTLIAREIHDEFGTILTALKIDLSWLAKKLPADQLPLIEKINKSTDLVQSAIRNVQRISGELRPGILDHLGLSAAIEWHTKEFGSRMEISCDISIDMRNTKPGRDVSTALFRILQESLTNIARYAEATEVIVSLREKDNLLILEVIDNGRGISEDKLSDPQSFGLMGIMERAQYFGGSVSIKGIPCKGTVVTVAIPLGGREISR